MDCKLAMWFMNAKHTLIDFWGWSEEQASKYIAGYMPHTTKYTPVG